MYQIMLTIEEYMRDTDQWKQTTRELEGQNNLLQMRLEELSKEMEEYKKDYTGGGVPGGGKVSYQFDGKNKSLELVNAKNSEPPILDITKM